MPPRWPKAGNCSGNFPPMRARQGVALFLSAVSFSLVAAAPAFAQGAEPAKKSSPSGIRVWAYLAPTAPLAGARVEIRDARGKVVARGRTTARGTYLARLSGRSPKLPLRVSTSGGRAAGRAFSGKMLARAFSTRLSSPITQVSLASSAAYRMSGSSKGYSRATSRVRSTLRITKGSRPDVLRLRNDDVGYAELTRAIRRTRGGFDAFARRVADLAERGKTIGGLRPRSASSSGVTPLPRARTAQSAPAPDTTVCSVALPSQSSSGDTSTEVISDIAEIGVGSLLEYAGAPVSASDGIAGMLFAPIGQNPEATILQEDVTAVANDLDCLDQQINYLSSQIAVLQLTVDVDTATDCSNAVSAGWQNYEYAINNASADPLNSSNTSLTGVYLPTWDNVEETCGSAVNSMLFGTSGGQQSAWQQLNKNTSAGLQWYTQAQAQELQTFLSYWGTILYQQFILANEFDNYYGYFEAAASAAGGSNPTGSSPVCDAGSGATTASYCVWQNNIAQAYPGNLYSDEIGIIASGQSIAAVPGGMVAGPQPSAPTGIQLYMMPPVNDYQQQVTYSPMAMTAQWWYDYFLNFQNVDDVHTCAMDEQDCPNAEMQFMAAGGPVNCIAGGMGGCPTAPSTNWAQTTIDWFNGLGVNPNGYGTAIETYNNPQVLGRTTVTASDVSALSSAGPDSASAESVFYDAVNQTPGGGDEAWAAVTDSQPTYMAADSSSAVTIQMKAVPYNFTLNYWVKAPLGNTASLSAGWSEGGLPTNNPTAFLAGRSWWPGAANATTYEPPPPPT